MMPAKHPTARTTTLTPRRMGLSLLGLALLTAASTAAAVAQKPAKAQPAGPAIVSVHATVEDMRTKRELGIVERGGHFEVTEGQQIRLRLVAKAGGNRNRYPSTRFTVNEGRHARVDKLNPDVGAVILTAGQPNTRGGAVPVQYEILEALNIDSRLRSGRFYLDVVADRPAPEPDPEPEPEPEPEELGVTLYTRGNYQGLSERITYNDRDLRDNRVGNDQVSSMRVDRGCIVELFAEGSFGGRYDVVEEDVPDFGTLDIGNDHLSSIRVDCREVGGGVTVYAEGGWRGRSQFFTGDVEDMGETRIGNDHASSVEVDEGCEVTLFSDAYFRGRSARLTDSVDDLRRTPVGNDRVSSLQVDCREPRRRR